MDVAVSRIVRDNWFADVPAVCKDWINRPTTIVTVFDNETPWNHASPRLEMLGEVVVKTLDRTVISCGGLIVSVTSELCRNVSTNVLVVFETQQ